MSKLDLALEDCLASIQLGEATLEECLTRYPELSSELRPLLLAAQQLKKTSEVRPSEQFMTRTRTLLGEHTRAHPRRPAWRSPQVVLRYAASLAVVALTFATTGFALAQDALPGGTLYPWKLASEQVWRRVHFDTVYVDLELTQRRLDELVAVQGDPHLKGQAVEAYAAALLTVDADVSRAPQKAAQVRDALTLQKELVNNSLGNAVGNVDDFFSILPRLDDLIKHNPQEKHQPRRQPTKTNFANLFPSMATLPANKHDPGNGEEGQKNWMKHILKHHKP